MVGIKSKGNQLLQLTNTLQRLDVVIRYIEEGQLRVLLHAFNTSDFSSRQEELGQVVTKLLV